MTPPVTIPMSARDSRSPASPRRSREPVRSVIVDEGNAGQRIDNFLKTLLKGVPATHIYRCLRRGEIRVNKGRVRQYFRLSIGDVVRLPPMVVKAEPDNLRPRDAELREITDSILYEDAGLLALNKPAGIAVHGGSGVAFGVIEILRSSRPNAPYLELVHRLDRETSGCLLIAKKRSILRQLHTSLRQRQLAKEYVALVQGRWEGGRRVVSANLRRSVLRSGERMVEVSDEGKPATTVLTPIERGTDSSLLRVRTRSGRTHQIRVHAASIGHPIAGDEKYGNQSFNQILKRLGLQRLFLHASALDFLNPGSGEQLAVAAPLPEALFAVLTNLGLSPDRPSVRKA